MSIDGDGYYMPFVPPRQDLDLDDIEDEALPTAEDLEVRHPPVGLSRAERRDWMRDEADRIARVQDRTRRNPLARKPPRGLGRAGRREWRQTDKARRKDWMERERPRAGRPEARVRSSSRVSCPQCCWPGSSCSPPTLRPSSHQPRG